MTIKKSIYQVNAEVAPGVYLHLSTLTNSFILLKQSVHELYSNCPDEQLHLLPDNLLKSLCAEKFVVEADCNEIEDVVDYRNASIENSSYYEITINPTLDCNLSCWYCYENRIANSRLSKDVLEGIEKHIEWAYNAISYKALKLSFFGGEPLLNFEGVKKILDFGRNFCNAHDVKLSVEFTTNATLLNAEKVEYLKDFDCMFQITLDGNEEHHNKIKVDQKTPRNTYRATIEALRLIVKNIPDYYIAVRINFDNKTLAGIERILNDIDFIDRRRSFVILKKVWQIDADKVDKSALMSAIEKVCEYRFLPDYYVMPKGSVCFAERRNQVLINYDGGVFKCTTIASFTAEHTLGKLDFNTGELIWDEVKTKDWFDDMQPESCKSCAWFPVCLGSCNRQLIAHKGENICTFDAFSLSKEEYLAYLFRYNHLKQELFNEKDSQ